VTVNSQQAVKRATITDVARLAGVSISTVSRVVNETAPVANETVEQVRNAIELLNYTPMAAARTLAGHKTNTIGLLLPQISSAFFSPLVSGIEAGARNAGYDMIVHLATDQQNGDRRTKVAAVGEHNTDGLVIFTDRLNNAELNRLWRNGLPMVLLFRSAPDGLTIPSIRFENRS
jgi:LacI family transcriptional regulator